MRLDFFLLASAAGFLATYAHLAFALVADRVGLVRLDYARGLAHLFFAEAFEGRPPYWLGLAAVHLNGVLFALLYAALAGPWLPGPPLVRGLLWGGVLFVGSQCIFNPLVTGHGFFSRKMHPRAWQTAVLAHAIYGAFLGWLCPLL